MKLINEGKPERYFRVPELHYIFICIARFGAFMYAVYGRTMEELCPGTKAIPSCLCLHACGLLCSQNLTFFTQVFFNLLSCEVTKDLALIWIITLVSQVWLSQMKQIIWLPLQTIHKYILGDNIPSIYHSQGRCVVGSLQCILVALLHRGERRTDILT